MESYSSKASFALLYWMLGYCTVCATNFYPLLNFPPFFLPLFLSSNDRKQKSVVYSVTRNGDFGAIWRFWGKNLLIKMQSSSK